MPGWAEKLSKMTQNAVTKSKYMAEITRINIEISNHESSLKQQISEIGQYVVDNGLLKDDANIQAKLERIAELQATIASSQATIEALRKANVCPNCGATLDLDVNFCPKCGASRSPAPIPGAQPQAVQKQTCPSCGTELENDETFCPNCGQRVK